MDPNNLQNSLNGTGNPNFQPVQTNAGGFGHQMAQTGAAAAAAATGQYNPMLLQQQYLNFGFGMNYNNQVAALGDFS